MHVDDDTGKTIGQYLVKSRFTDAKQPSTQRMCLLKSHTSCMVCFASLNPGLTVLSNGLASIVIDITAQFAVPWSFSLL